MKQIVLRHVPPARPEATDFVAVEVAPPACPEDGVVIDVVHVSLDPYVGSRLRGRHMGEPAPRPGVDPIPGAVVGQIAHSRVPHLAEGQWVHSMQGAWAEKVALSSHALRPIEVHQTGSRAHLGALGMPGLTAWAGITQLARAGAGDQVLVDAAAGAVGGMAGQIARLRGASRVVGIAGGPAKCALVRERYGFDACVDYRADGWEDAVGLALPEGASVHFENVSVGMATMALQRLRPYGRMVLCGLVDQYHADTVPPGLPAGLVIGRRAVVLGLVVYDFYPRWDEFVAEIAPHVASGGISIAEDVAQGLDAAPGLFERLMRGENIGKAVVDVGQGIARPG
jgi:NADPH-dependent curcumin reductase CurA